MSRSLLFSLLFAPSVAFAGASPKTFLAGAESVEFGFVEGVPVGSVEVPLLVGPGTKYLPAVWATLPKRPAKGKSLDASEPVPSALAIVDLGSRYTTISSGLAGALGLEVKNAKLLGNDEQKYTTIPEIRVGSLVLKNVAAFVGGESALQLGFGTFDELTVAVLPSKGVVKVVPVAEASALFAEVGNPMPVARIPAEPWYEHGDKKFGNGLSLSVWGKLFGKEGQILINTDRASSYAAADTKIPEARLVRGVEGRVEAAMVGGIELPPTWIMHRGQLTDPKGEVIGAMGYDVLYSLDIALNPATNQVAFRLVDAPKSADPAVQQLAAAKLDFEYAVKKAGEADKKADTTKTAAAPKTASDMPQFDKGSPDIVARETAYADAFAAASLLDEALIHYQAAAAAAGENCSPYLALGRSLLSSGDAAAALEPLTRAGVLWDRWYSQSRDIRLAVKAKKDVADAVFTLPQDSTCHEGWGELAAAELALGHYDKVATLHAKHTDLDPQLPLAQALGLIAQGQPEFARGPLQEAINLGERNGSSVRAALAMAEPGLSGKVALERMILSEDDTYQVQMWALIEASRQAQGDAAVRAMLEHALQVDPLSLQASMLYARELTRVADASAEVARAAFEARLKAFGQSHPNVGVAEAYLAVSRALAGNTEGAKAALVDAGVRFPRLPTLYVASALVAEFQGDTAGAKIALDELRKRDPLLAASFVRIGSGG